ncbi:hypothetical protein ACFX2B_044540 [Malus domestica]
MSREVSSVPSQSKLGRNFSPGLFSRFFGCFLHFLSLPLLGLLFTFTITVLFRASVTIPPLRFPLSIRSGGGDGIEGLRDGMMVLLAFMLFRFLSA